MRLRQIFFQLVVYLCLCALCFIPTSTTATPPGPSLAISKPVSPLTLYRSRGCPNSWVQAFGKHFQVKSFTRKFRRIKDFPSKERLVQSFFCSLAFRLAAFEKGQGTLTLKEQRSITRILLFLKKQKSKIDKQYRVISLRIFSRMMRVLFPYIHRFPSVPAQMRPIILRWLRLFTPFISPDHLSKAKEALSPLRKALLEVEDKKKILIQDFAVDRKKLIHKEARLLALNILRVPASSLLSRRRRKEKSKLLRELKSLRRSYQKHQRQLDKLYQHQSQQLRTKEQQLTYWRGHLKRGLKRSPLTNLGLRKAFALVDASLILLKRYRISLQLRRLFRTFQHVPYRYGFVNRQGKLTFIWKEKKQRRLCKRKKFQPLHECRTLLHTGLNCVTYGNLLVNMAVGMRRYSYGTAGTVWNIIHKSEYQRTGIPQSPLLYDFPQVKIQTLANVLETFGSLFFVQMYEVPREPYHAIILYIDYLAKQPTLLLTEAIEPQVTYGRDVYQTLKDLEAMTYDIFLVDPKRALPIPRTFHKRITRSVLKNEIGLYLAQHTELLK